MANVRINYIVDKSQIEAADDALKDLNRTEGITEKETQKLANKFRDANTDSGRFKRGVNDAGGELRKFNNLAQSAGKLLAGLFAVQQLTSFAKSIVETTGKFQTFEAVLTNTLGSNSKARKALDQISKFAAQTPFSVDQLTNSFVKLANQGFVPTTDELRKLGDLAASTGKDFDMLTEALIDAQVGEFERLKEFGIRASKEGGNVTFAFKGVQTQTEFTNEAIREYILSLGDLQGVQGATAAIAATVTGKVSNLGDNFTQLQNNIGSANSGLISSILDLANNALGALNDQLSETNKIAKQVEEQGITKPGFFEGIAIALNPLKGGITELLDRIDAYNQAIADTKFENQLAESAFNRVSESIKGLNAEDSIQKLDEALQGFIINDLLREKLVDLRNELIASSGKIQDYVKAWGDLTKEQQQTFIKTGELRLELMKTQEAFVEFSNQVAKEIAEGEANVMAKIITEASEDGAKAIKKLSEEDKILGDILSQILTEGEQANKDYYDTATRLNEEFTEDYKEKAEERKKADKGEEEYRRRLIEESFNLAHNTNEAIFSISNNRIQREINALESQKEYEVNLTGRTEEQKQATEDRFDRQIQELRRKQAVREKAMALFGIALNTAEGVVKAIAESPLTFGLPFSAFALAAGGLQAGVVASTPLPFNKGTKRVPGSGNTDTVPAILTPGEGVMPVDRMREYRPAFEAIFDRKIRPEVLNSFVNGTAAPVFVNNDMTEVARAIKGQPKKLVTIDKNGFMAYQISESQRVAKKLERYKG